MASESDLRELLVELEAGAPSVRAVLDSLPPNDAGRGMSVHHRRRGWTVAGAVAASVALAFGIGVLSGATDHARAPAGSGTASPERAEVLPTWHFSVAPLAGYTVSRDSIIGGGKARLTSSSQRATITATGSRVAGRMFVEVAAPGVPGTDFGNFQEVASGRKARKVLTINDHPAYFVAGTPLTPKQLSGKTDHPKAPTPMDRWDAAAEFADNEPQLYWQLSPGTVVEATGTFGFEPDAASWDNPEALRTLEQVARATRYAPHDAVTMPFRLAEDPAGLVPVGMFGQPGTQCLAYGTGRVSGPHDPTWNWYELCRFTGPQPNDLPASPAPLARRTLRDGTTLALFTGGRPHQPTPVTRSAAAALLAGADVLPTLADPSTWLPVR